MKHVDSLSATAVQIADCSAIFYRDIIIDFLIVAGENHIDAGGMLETHDSDQEVA